MAKKSIPPSPIRNMLKRAKARADAEPDRFRPGSVVGERYEIIAELGKGGYGVVYRARDRQSGFMVAVKVLHDHVVNEELKLRMHREAHAMGQLAGTCAVAIHDYAATRYGQLYLVMELLEGHNLQELLEAFEQERKRLSPAEIVSILGPIIATLRVAHERGIIHRDLKPENIFVLREAGEHRTRLLDFGLVKDLNLAKLTEAGMVAGSPSYIAPESWGGQPDQLDHRIDVYSLGVIVYRILAGQVPFEASTNMFELITAVTSGPRPSLLALRPDLHPGADAWTQRALAVKPEERFQSVQELWDGLAYVLPQRA